MTRRRSLKILVFVLLIPILAIAFVPLWIGRVADRRWAAAQDRIRQLVASHAVVLPPMPPAGRPKELQIHFVAAIKEAAQGKAREPEALKLESLRRTGDGVDSVLADAQGFLDRLHQGARECAAHREDFPPGWRMDWDETSVQFMIHCVLLQARRWRAQGRPKDAAETLLDALQLGRFWIASGAGDHVPTALHHLGRVHNGLREILEEEQLSREQLESMARELEPLEAAIPSPIDTAERHLARWGERLATMDVAASGYLGNAPYRWRTVLPDRLMKAESFEFGERCIQQLRSAAAEGFPAMLQHVQRTARFTEESKNPLIRSGRAFAWAEWRAFERLAELRVLRAAAHYRATGDVLTLRDPFGEDLRHSRTDQRMRFWSRDVNGVDDGGDGGTEGWGRTPPLPGKAVPLRRRDIVIEVEHPKPE